jgi:hypothetical protein
VSSWLKEDGGMLLLEAGFKVPVSKPNRKKRKAGISCYPVNNELFTNIISNCYWPVYFTLTQCLPGFCICVHSIKPAKNVENFLVVESGKKW